MIQRLPPELRSGIVPRILNWFLTCTNMPVNSIDPRAERLPEIATWNDLQGSIRACAYRTPYQPIDDYMDRWWFMPEIFGERARVHRVRRSDHERDLHDHPWHFVSVILEGGYSEEIEIIPGTGITDTRRYRPGDVLFRHAEHRHRLELHEGDCWSLVFTSPNVREWGFWKADGAFVPWRQYEPESVPA